ncbi:glycosyltransferase [Chlamydiota bacterium]
MKIVWISSWPPRHCGIATYSYDLVSALRARNNKVLIVCHQDGGKKEEQDVFPIIDLKNADWDDVIYRKVKEIAPDLVHIQHEYALYNRNNDYSAGLLRLLFRLKVEQHSPVVITYHSVYSTLNESEKNFTDVALRLTGAGIVHEGYQWMNLPVNLGWVPQNVYVIPHGAKDVKKYPRRFRQFSYEAERVIGLLGWWEPNKGFERVIRLWPEIYQKLSRKYRLMVAGDARPGSTSGPQAKEIILQAVETSPIKETIDVIIGSFSPEDYDSLLSCMDIMVLPYTHASQSGNLAHSFALGVPAVVTALEGLKSQIEESGAGIACSRDDDLDLIRGILTLANDDALRQRYSQNARTYVTDQIVWSIVASKHERLYEKVRTFFDKAVQKRSLDGKIHL